MTGFWRGWLTVWCWGVLIFGAVLAGGGLEATDGIVRLIFKMLDGPGEVVFNPAMRFSLAVMGAVSIGWSITFMAAFKAANLLEQKQRRSVWGLVTVSAVVWFVIDSILSAATGFGLNIVPNTLLLVGFLIPVIRNGVLNN